jgi:hypothetical protein
MRAVRRSPGCQADETAIVSPNKSGFGWRDQSINKDLSALSENVVEFLAHLSDANHQPQR